MSTNRRIYLDFNATSPLGEPARLAMAEAMAEVGNPSSVHAEGRRARDRVERARARVAGLVGRPPEQVVFTSGGTEANLLGVLALANAAEQRGLPRVVATTPIEHPSLRGPVDELVRRGWQLRMLAPFAESLDGRACPAGSGSIDDGVGLLAVAYVNHELGTLLSPGLLVDARERGVLIHVDAVQAAGKLALEVIIADALAVSAHKLGGPQGVGALAIAHDQGMPIVDGGHQERGRRPGTENALGIVGFGAAAAAVDLNAWRGVALLGEQLETGVRALGLTINGGDRPRVGGTINVGIPGALGEAVVMALDLEGIAVSTGAACTSGSIQPSPVLLGLGMTPAHAREAVRFSLGRTTTADEIEEVLGRLPPIIERARRHR